MDWKGTVTTVSDSIFPGINKKVDDELPGTQVMSNLPLQMSLYFNVVFFPLWMTVTVVFLSQKYNCYDELHKFIVITIVVAVFVVEILRLYLGYEGNLRDKIPELAGFWMLSLLLQLPLQGILLFNPYFQLNVIEILTQGIVFIMLCLHIVFGYLALKYTSTQQATYFKTLKTTGNLNPSTSQDDSNKQKF